MNSNLSDQIQAIKNQINIIEVIGNFERLKKRGRFYLCKCPLHNEHTPSFTVTPAKGTFKCYGCGTYGDAINFLQLHLNIDFMAAMKWLADFYHLPLDESSPRTYAKPKARTISRQQEPGAVTPSFISKDIFNKSLQQYNENNLITFLHTLFEPCIVNMLIEKYYIGTSKYYPGGCIFWQVDESGNIRSGKIMPYNPETGKRIRTAIVSNGYELPPTNWVHSVLQLKDFNLQQCFYGQHLLCEDTSTPIAIVESEKTAIIASVFIPSFIWIASGSKGYEKYNKKGEINVVPDLLREKYKALAGRKVVLFPDLGAVEDWQHLAGELSDITSIEVNDLLQTAATQYQLPDKSDLCDYLTSEAARTELVNEFKEALIQQAPQTISEGLQIWLDFSDKGLRRKDCSRAINEIRQEYDFDSSGLLIGQKINSAT